jgi:hypothetical protein
MNKLLAAARQRMRGQKAKVTSGFDNTPIPEGKYVAEIKQSEIKDKEIDGIMTPCFVQRLSICLGDKKGKSVWPFAPNLTTPEGLTAAARAVSSILGAEAITAGKQVGGELELDLDKFMIEIENLAPQCVGEKVEINIKNSKKHRPDGTPYQSVYINRGLGEDAKALEDSDKDAEAVGLKAPAPTTKGKVVARKR